MYFFFYLFMSEFNEELYLVLKDLKGKGVILETDINSKEKVINKLQNNDVIIEMSEDKFTCIEKKYLTEKQLHF